MSPAECILGALLLVTWTSSVQSQLTFRAGTAGTYAGPGDVDPRRKVGDPVVGSCGYGELRQSQWPYFSGASISPKSTVYQAAGMPTGGCGRCLEIQCTDEKRCKGQQPVQALVVDTCDSCAPDQLNLPFPVFVGNLTNNYRGAVPIRFRQVPCTPPGNIAIDVTMVRPSSGGFIQLALNQVSGDGALSSVKLRSTSKGGKETSFATALVNDFGAVWQSKGVVPVPPLDVQITNAAGVPLIARAAIPALHVGRYPTTVQFPA